MDLVALSKAWQDAAGLTRDYVKKPLAEHEKRSLAGPSVVIGSGVAGAGAGGTVAALQAAKQKKLLAEIPGIEARSDKTYQKLARKRQKLRRTERKIEHARVYRKPKIETKRNWRAHKQRGKVDRLETRFRRLGNKAGKMRRMSAKAGHNKKVAALYGALSVPTAAIGAAGYANTKRKNRRIDEARAQADGTTATVGKSWKGSATDDKRSVIGPAGVTGVGAATAATGGAYIKAARDAEKLLADKEFNLASRRGIHNQFKQARKEKRMRVAESRAEDARAAGNKRAYRKRKARAANKSAGLERLKDLESRLARREASTRHLKESVRASVKPAAALTAGAVGVAGLGAAGLVHTVRRNRRIDAARARADGGKE